MLVRGVMVSLVLGSLLVDELSQVHVQTLKHYVEFVVFNFNPFCVDDVWMVKQLQHLQFSLLKHFFH